MARFRITAPYSGKAQQDLAARVESLIDRGLTVPLPATRRAVTKIENENDLLWCGGQASDHPRGHYVASPSQMARARQGYLPSGVNIYNVFRDENRGGGSTEHVGEVAGGDAEAAKGEADAQFDCDGVHTLRVELAEDETD